MMLFGLVRCRDQEFVKQMTHSVLTQKQMPLPTAQAFYRAGRKVNFDSVNMWFSPVQIVGVRGVERQR
jgi:hypothetical protein